jgi:hypothetical protein
LIDLRELEVPMKRGLLAALSPYEQTALRRVADGISRPDQLRPPAVARLKQLALVEEQDGRVRLTPLGTERCRANTAVAASSG